ncbi:MobF family relaxase [Pectinatus frisingensis]|uniref:MobF family relaxase n=1 Tax=Pectinatus frisingensis TaxID=865 RepID=UPI003D808F59
MITIMNISKNQAITYYNKDDYYTLPNDVNNGWQGHLAPKYNHGNIVKDFNNAIISMKNPKRVGYDICFSPPKSMSIAIILDDKIEEEILTIHEKIVSNILKFIESDIVTRVTTNAITENVKTGKFAVMKFHHYVSREQDIQIHIHAVILNITKYNKKYYAISNESIYYNKLLYQHLYHNQLAKALQKAGYNLYVTDFSKGFFEIDGITRKYIENFSKRHFQILAKLREWNKFSPKAHARAVILTRKPKKYIALEILKEKWRNEIKDIGYITINKSSFPIKTDIGTKRKIFYSALDKISNNEYVFTKRALELSVLAEGVIDDITKTFFDKMLNEALNNENILFIGRALGTVNEEIFYTTYEIVQKKPNIIKNIMLLFE